MSVTLPTSNVVLDFQQLRSLATVISGIDGEKNRLRGIEDVMRNAFLIINAIDETFFPLCIPDSCSISAVQTALEMYSQAEKMEELVIKDKERETKERAKEKMKQLEAMRKEKKHTAPSTAALIPSTMQSHLSYSSSPPSTGVSSGDETYFIGGSTAKSGGMQLSKKKPQISSTLINAPKPIVQQKEADIVSIEQVTPNVGYVYYFTNMY